MKQIFFLIGFGFFFLTASAECKAEICLNCDECPSCQEECPAVQDCNCMLDDDCDIEMMTLVNPETDASPLIHKFSIYKIKRFVIYVRSGFTSNEDIKKHMKFSADHMQLVALAVATRSGIYSISSKKIISQPDVIFNLSVSSSRLSLLGAYRI